MLVTLQFRSSGWHLSFSTANRKGFLKRRPLRQTLVSGGSSRSMALKLRLRTAEPEPSLASQPSGSRSRTGFVEEPSESDLSSGMAVSRVVFLLSVLLLCRRVGNKRCVAPRTCEMAATRGEFCGV